MRIISLFPAATEMVCALGAADALVGISHDSDYPAEFLHDGIPRVTRSTIDSTAAPAEIDRMVRVADTLGESLYVMDAEKIASLEPDIIITQGTCDVCAIREADVRIIAESLYRPPVVLSLSASSLDEMFDDIRRVGSVIERSPLAEALISRLESRLRRVHERLVAAAVPRPRVAVLEWTDPIYNAGHWVPQMVRRAGGIEVLARAGERSRVVTMDEVVAAKADTVVIAPCGYDASRAAAEGAMLMKKKEWAWLTHCRAWAIDSGGLLSRPGPRLVEGVETLAEIFHPTVFPRPSRARALELSAS
ncbi:MAG: ABC transporter substrate-binding protein [Gemmatimonadaceae bacterium]|nr:ABC transporter substrate-binding protein [Gemmatimonadaceae bacterium]